MNTARIQNNYMTLHDLQRISKAVPQNLGASILVINRGVTGQSIIGVYKGCRRVYYNQFRGMSGQFTTGFYRVVYTKGYHRFLSVHYKPYSILS